MTDFLELSRRYRVPSRVGVPLVMMTPNDYRAQAAECLQLLKHVGDDKARIALIEIAQILLRLADQSDKNSQTDLVYETPPRRIPLAQ